MTSSNDPRWNEMWDDTHPPEIVFGEEDECDHEIMTDPYED